MSAPLDDAIHPPSWQEHAACQHEDPDLFFPDRGADAPRKVAQAKEICRGCPVRIQCLMYARQNGEKQGVWGGEYFKPSARRRKAS